MWWRVWRCLAHTTTTSLQRLLQPAGPSNEWIAIKQSSTVKRAQQTVKEGAGKVGEASHVVIAPIKAAIEQKTLQPVVEVDAGPSEVVVDVANASANE